MKRIYYLQKIEVELGDVIEYNGIKTLVTEELIELNPELFIVEDPIQELMDKAVKDYPIGTVFNNGSGIQRVTGNNHQCMPLFKNIVVSTDIFAKGGTIYHPIDGWAEILPLKFTTEDGVGIYEDMKTYAVAKGDLDIDNSEIYGGTSPCFKYFYHKENALAYIEKHKEKTLEDYEDILFEDKGTITFGSRGMYFSVYGWLKDNEPKLYYTKIFQLIADDLNDGRYIHIRGNTSYHLSNAHGVNVHCGGDEGCVYFKSEKLAQKAKDILGNKVNYLFN